MHDYDDYENLDDFDIENIQDSELDVFDKREVSCFEVTKWDWCCPSCGIVNTENTKPRFGKLVSCIECQEIFSATLEDE